MLDSRRPEGPNVPRSGGHVPLGSGPPVSSPQPPMSDDDRLDITTPASKPRLKWLRLFAILVALGLLGVVSFVFGMFVSIASDLPSLTAFSQLKEAKSSVLLDDLGHPIGVLSQQNRVIVTPEQIPKIVKEAVISIEEKRFQSNSG